MLARGRLDYVTRERCRVQANQYDLTVYRLWGQFFAVWRCERCARKGRCRLHSDHVDAYEDGLAAIHLHAARHLSERPTRHISCVTVYHTSHDPRPRD